MLESFENCAKSLQFPRITINFVFTAETEAVEPDVRAVLMVTCYERETQSDVRTSLLLTLN